MKKGKVFGKSQVAVTVMVLALAAAIWLNMEYAPTSTKHLGEASYVSNSSQLKNAVQTSAKVDSSSDDYFESTKKEREKSRTKAQEAIKEILDNDKLTEEDKKSALAKIEEISARMESEGNIEALIRAKGFEKTLAVMSDNEINIVVSAEGLTSAQILQIQDIVTSQTNISLSNIKIIPVK